MAATPRTANSMTTCRKVVYDTNYIDSTLDETEGKRVFVLASKSLDKESDIVSKLVQKLEEQQQLSGLLTGIEQHTSDSSCIRAANLVRDSGADCVVTLGEGAVTDASKAIRICLTYNIQDASGFRQFQRASQIYNPLPIDFKSDLTVINIPTTLSAAAYSLVTGLKDTETGAKFGYLHDNLVPDVVILDPNTTVHTPEQLWISSGVRAIDHSIETICSPMTNMLADTACKQGLKLLIENLKPSKNVDSTGLSARKNCLLGAWLSSTGLTQDIPMGGSHGIGHILGTYGVSHGYTSCIMAPHVVKYNWDHMNSAMQSHLVEAFGETEPPHKALFQFIRDLMMPQSLSDVGIKKDDIPHIAQKATLDLFTQGNLRPLNVFTIEQILHNAYATDSI